ncbi:MAG: cytochrome P450 [Chloroflexota bacterium]|nr:cytochrome P450 [Chloroflexota bacterium]
MSETHSRRRKVIYNPAAAEIQQNPFPTLRHLREQDPVHLTRQGWVLTRYDDCAVVLASRQFGMRGIEDMLRRQMGPGPALEFIAKRFHSYDPPEHTRLRRLVAKAFSAHRVEEMRGHIEGLAERFLDQVGTVTAFDLVDKFACPLPSWVSTEVLGTPMDERTQMNVWTERILTLQGMARPDKATLEEGNASAKQFMVYMRRFIEARRKEPGNDLVSALIAAEEQGDLLTAEEIAECVVFLSNAGFSTTRNLIANAVVALLRNREQWELLVDDPSLIGEAVAEALRYDCSLTSTPRFARQETIVGNRKVAAGAAVFCLLNAANRDPERFPDPDRFDITRTDKKHLAFGGGIHFCLGARLARLQIEVALSALLRRYPRLRLGTEKIEWRSGLYRGPIQVPVITG